VAPAPLNLTAGEPQAVKANREDPIRTFLKMLMK